MRIISQNRECDVNYDSCFLEYDFSTNNAHCVLLRTHVIENDCYGYFLATYESKERCLEVMESIRNSYTRDSKIFLMPEE